MNLTVSNTNRILRSGNGPTVEYTGQDPIQVNNATHIISLNSAFSAQFAESGVEAKVDELSSCCEQVHSSISSLETQVSSLETQISAISSEIPDTSDFLTKASADTLYQPIGDYLTHDESGAFQPAGDYILRNESGAFQPSGDYLTVGILNTLATKQEVRITSGFIQGEINYISGAISAYPNRDELSAAIENIPEYILSGNSNITATSAQDGKNIRWDLRVAATPVVTDTTIVGESGVYAHETSIPGQWQVELTQSAYSAINEVSNKLDKSFSSNFYPMTGNPSAFVVSTELANYQTTAGMTGYATTAQVDAVSSLLSAGLDYVSANAGTTYSAGEGIDISVNGDKTIISNNISAGPGISLVYDVETNKIRIDGEGREYSGIAPIQVNNSTNQISADTWSLSAGEGLKFTDDNTNKVTKLEVEGEALSAGPNIDIFASGGYVIISADGGNSFPITGTNGTTGFTANMDCSSVLLTTASSPAGGYVKQTVQGVQYEAYPATNVSASWYNIISAANNRSNCYCIRFTNDMTAADLANYSAYDKVTVVHSNEYTQDCNLYWDGNTKVFPSGLYCELVKGTNDQNQIDWFFTTSGWTNNLWWDWD